MLFALGSNSEHQQWQALTCLDASIRLANLLGRKRQSTFQAYCRWKPLKILASSRASLTSLRLAADNIKPFDAASQVSLEGVWPDILRFTRLQSLALVEIKDTVYMGCDLVDLTVLTGLTSLWLQQGQISPHGGNPTRPTQLVVGLNDFEYVLDELNLQCLTLANIRCNTHLNTFWEGTSLQKLKHLRLDYITFDEFDHSRGSESASVAMPLALSRLVDLR